MPALAHARTRIRRLSLLVASTLPFAACVGVDPRIFERLSYGMEQHHVAEVLEQPSIPVMRFFAADALGREQDVVIEVYEGYEPHADYALVSIDGRLASMCVASGPRSFIDPWWRDPVHWDWRDFLCPWWPHELRDLVAIADERRLPLEWDRLEPIDSAHPTSGRYTALGMSIVYVFPLVLYVPYYAWRELFDGRLERADAARSFLLTTPAGTTMEQVVARLGPPASDRAFEQGHSVQRVHTYELAGSFTFTIGFVDGRLLWADFGTWYDWSWAFVHMDIK